MSVEENKAIARRFIEEGWHNLDILDEIVVDEIALPEGKTISLDEYKQIFSWLNTGFPDVRHVIVWIFAQEDSVVAGWRCEATHTKEWEGILPTKKRGKWTGCTNLRIVDGKIVELWHLWDRFAAMSQLGYIPTWQEMIEQAKSKQA
jgi:predicted ester cyclase